ncbi:hypothetical protein FRB98_002308, partial [Tulasnella sp. 332]
QADRADGRHVFSTIAYQLAYVMSSFQARLIEAIKADPEARSSDLSTQLQKLIIKPLHGVVDAPSPLVIVLDALDECEDPIDAREIITLLANATVQFPPYLHLKILITSRPEVHLYPPFPRWISLVTSVVANLHDVKEPDVKADIKIYLRDRLLGEDEVATDEEIDRLVEMAQGAFFVASSAVQFIDNSYSQSLLGRKKQLQIILATESSYRNPNLLTLEVPQPRGPPPYRALDVMYSNILSKALPAEHDSDFEEHLRSVLGSVILLFDLLSPKSLETLLRLEPHTITETLARLRSVIVVPENDQDSSSLRIIHPHMSESLGRDMCDIGSLPALNSDVLDLPTCLDRSIPSYLRYACRYWPAHLVSAKLVPDSNKYLSEQVIHQLASVVEKFVSTKLLCWLEVLSLLGSLDAAVPLLKLVEQGLAGMANLVEDTLAVIGDAQRLVTQFFDPMSASTATIYSSALPSMVNCRLYNIYQHELDGSVVSHDDSKNFKESRELFVATLDSYDPATIVQPIVFVHEARVKLLGSVCFDRFTLLGLALCRWSVWCNRDGHLRTLPVFLHTHVVSAYPQSSKSPAGTLVAAQMDADEKCSVISVVHEVNITGAKMREEYEVISLVTATNNSISHSNRASRLLVQIHSSGDESTPGAAIPLAVRMLFAGFSSTVGRCGRLKTERLQLWWRPFIEQMSRNDLETADYRDAVKASSHGVDALRRTLDPLHSLWLVKVMLKTLAKRKAHKEGLNPTEPSGSPEMSQSFGYSHASASGSQLSMATADSSTSDVSSSHNTIRPHALSDTSPAQSRVTLASTNSSTSNESWLSRVILPRNALSIASRVTSQATFMTIGSSVSNEPQTSHFVGMRDAISVVGAPGSSLESGRVYALPSGGGSEGSDTTITPNPLSNTIISKSRFTLPYFKGLIRTAKKPKISTPIDPVHLKHIGFNGSIGDFRGVPKQWERLFKESEISRSNRAQQPQAMMEIINFSKDTVADPYGNDDADSFVGHADTAAYLALSLTPMHISSPNLLHQLSHSSQQLPPDLEKSTSRPGTSQPPSRVAETTTPSTFTSDSDGITEKNEGSVADDETEIHGAEADLDVEDEDEDELILAGGTGIPIGP